jgi:hypothetical protein
MMQRLKSHDSKLVMNLEDGAWAAITVNLGPQTVTYKHRDRMNKLTGWCCITALGDNFNDEEGGHLILWDLNLVIRFPAGASIMIPSALFYHSNVTIRLHETRYSIAQHTSGNLFRWVANGFQSDANFQIGADNAEKAKRREIESKRQKDNILNFLPYDKLHCCL